MALDSVLKQLEAKIEELVAAYGETTAREQELAAKLEANPDDHEARFQLALRKVVEQDYDAAIELLLELMQKDRSFGDDAARNGLLKVFELLGDDPRVGQYRRRMASLLH